MMASETVVLVHGGFVDGSGWQGVYDELKHDGYSVSVVQKTGMIPPTAQREMSTRAGATVVEAAGGPRDLPLAARRCRMYFVGPICS